MSSKPSTLDPDLIAGLVSYLLHDNSLALDHFRTYTDGICKAGDLSEFGQLAYYLSEHIKFRKSTLLIKDLKLRIANHYKEYTHIDFIYFFASYIINSQDYHHESKFPRHSTMIFSNGSIPSITNQIIAILLYIIRGYNSLLKHSSPITNDLAASKAPLNDFSQAEKLVEVLKQDSCLTYDLPLDAYHFTTPNPNDTTLSILGLSKSQIISLLSMLVNIYKGLIYKYINFKHNALDSFYSAIRIYQSSFQSFFESGVNPRSKTPLLSIITLLYFETSKLLFDSGKFIDSIINHIAAITHIAHISYIVMAIKANKSPQRHRKFKSILNELKAAQNVLNNIKMNFRSYILKDILLGIFIEHSTIIDFHKLISSLITNCDNRPVLAPNPFSVSGIPPLTSISTYIPDELKVMLSDILAGLGFALYVIRERIMDDRLRGALSPSMDQSLIVDKLEMLHETSNKMLEHIKRYFQPYDGFESELGTYTLSLLEGKDSFISHKIERIFSSCASRVISSSEILTDDRIRGMFCKKLTQHVLMDAANISSIAPTISDYLGQAGYKIRTGSKRYQYGRSLLNRFVVLRRWQSFNPKVPRPKGQDIRGGGYFLFWEGMGTVVDPGYGFIRNFYEEGFSIADIDAIVVTHTHPDHDDELNTILTLLAEWNQLQRMGLDVPSETKEPKLIDLFLNEGAYRKYSSWLYAKDIMIGKIFLLQSCLWGKATRTPSDTMSERGNNVRLDVRSKYSYEIDTIPAWHDELIDKHSSIGVIFRLFYKSDVTNIDNPQISIGYTGDTQYFDNLDWYYRSVDILVAHIGDIKLRELISHYEDRSQCLSRFIYKWFAPNMIPPGIAQDAFVNYIISKDLFGLDTDSQDGVAIKTQKSDQISDLKKTVCSGDYDIYRIREIERLFHYHCFPSNDYIYKNHLGIRGICKLFETLGQDPVSDRFRLMIIGELPEELLSYRHLIACNLNEVYQDSHRKCVTGDIGLTIGLPTEGLKFSFEGDFSPLFAIRCVKCNQNNENIRGKTNETGDVVLGHYHAPHCIQEISVKARSSRIAWYCKRHIGAPNGLTWREFVTEPDLRAVWG